MSYFLRTSAKLAYLAILSVTNLINNDTPKKLKKKTCTDKNNGRVHSPHPAAAIYFIYRRVLLQRCSRRTVVERSFCFSKFKLLGFFRTYKFGHIAGIVSLQCCCYSSYTYSFGRIALFQRSSSTSATTKYTLHSLQGYSYVYSFGRIALLHRSSQ